MGDARQDLMMSMGQAGPGGPVPRGGAQRSAEFRDSQAQGRQFDEDLMNRIKKWGQMLKGYGPAMDSDDPRAPGRQQ